MQLRGGQSLAVNESNSTLQVAAVRGHGYPKGHCQQQPQYWAERIAFVAHEKSHALLICLTLNPDCRSISRSGVVSSSFRKARGTATSALVGSLAPPRKPGAMPVLR